MIKKILPKFLSALAAGALITVLLCTTGCGSAPKEETEAPEAPVVTKKEPAKPEPNDPPNVKFVKQLQALLEKGDTEGAIAHFDSIPASLKDDLELKNLLGALYYSNAQYDEGISTAYEILAIDEQNMDALELISMCNKAKGDKKAYKEASDKILAVDPYNASVNIQKAEEYAVNKKYKLARDSYKKALRGDPDNLDALFGYAQMSYYTDDIKTAEETFQQILEKEPDNPAALAYMGFYPEILFWYQFLRAPAEFLR